MNVFAAPRAHTGLQRIYRSTDWIGWGILGFVAAVLLITGVTIHNGLVANHHPLLGDASLLLMGGALLLWITLFASFRVLVYLIVSPAGVTMVHGLWRHTIGMLDIVRVSEWTTLQDGMQIQWMAIWSVDGTRIQLRQDAVRDFAAFRDDIVRELSHVQGAPDSVIDVEHSFYMAEEIAMPLANWGYTTVVTLLASTLIVAYIPTFRLLGIALGAVGIIALLMVLKTRFLRQLIVIGPAGVGSLHGPFKMRIPWEQVYTLDRKPDQRGGGILGILGRGLLLILFRIDNRTGMVMGPIRTHSTIRVRGGSGVGVTIHERSFQHPEWLRARLRAEIEWLHAQATPVAPRVSSLPPTGPLAPGTVLPPDPMEGDSEIWLRESGGNDPFRYEGSVRP